MPASHTNALDFMQWTWSGIEPLYRELERRDLSEETVESFLLDWTHLSDRVVELGRRLKTENDANTADEEVAERYRAYVEEVSPRVREAEQALTRKLLDSGLEPRGLEVPLRRMRVDAELFREENLPLLSQEQLLGQEYFQVTGSQSIQWDGKEIPLTQIRPVLEETDRTRREQIWRLAAARRLEDRDRLDEIWRKLLELRLTIAANAGYSDYRSYRWRDLKRFDYTPDDTKEFHRSMESVAVPVVARLHQRRRRLLGVESLRPWDTNVDVLGRPPLRPYAGIDELTQKSSAIFHRVDPGLGAHFDTMRREELLDLDSRKNKAPGGYCTDFPASRHPFIFMNASGTQVDVETVFHEGGHAFHTFESGHLPYAPQRGFDIPIEFSEVASMAMELLAEPYLTSDEGGFYTGEDAARARLNHLEERVLVLWCRIVAMDAFQHWVYENPDEASDGGRCDAVWFDLIERFIPGIDRTGIEGEQASGWRDVLHFFVVPFYMIEYAFAQLGAIQVWANAQRDPEEAVRHYRYALSLGGTAGLPDLFAAAGVRFAFDEGTLREAVKLVERTFDQLDREGAPA